MAVAAAQQLRMAPSLASLLLPRVSAPVILSSSRWATFYAQEVSHPLLPSLSIGLPGVQLSLPTLLGDIWESILRAVPKKKTSHSKKRHRQMAGKALKDVNSLCRCPGCGQTKRMHRLCPHCMESKLYNWLSSIPTHFFTPGRIWSSSHGMQYLILSNKLTSQPSLTFFQSKQYLTVHTVDNAHLTDIFALAATPKAVLSASGSSSVNVHETTSSTFSLTQTISAAHPLGCHHLCASGNGKVAASAGFGGEIKVWNLNIDSGEWIAHSEIPKTAVKDASIWAIALNENGQFLATTTRDGRVIVWDVVDKQSPKIIREYETGSGNSGSFGMCVDLSNNGKFTASGHQNGTVYVFNNDTGRLVHCLTGSPKAIRTVAFSPGSSRLAAGGDSAVIALYDMQHGEQVGILTGHSAWVTSVDWNDSGEFLLSGSMDGKAKVWSIDRKVCVATHSETEKPLWSVKWLPKTGRSEFFCTAGSNRSISFYREATGA
ncbi:hypothetical protein jhhlp_005616 [Lomentospora prolificans]|uniref:Uncharacterized protein n=1 Tax=Lomentospora prolificans TaxID=41688 RepID=A0A2N3N3M7_9PEZI|nr:hypothetical protein jhhlp_005616 [Lomentospora prolificans]